MNGVVKKARFYVTANDPIRFSQFRNEGGISWWESFIFGRKHSILTLKHYKNMKMNY